MEFGVEHTMLGSSLTVERSSCACSTSLADFASVAGRGTGDAYARVAMVGAVREMFDGRMNCARGVRRSAVRRLAMAMVVLLGAERGERGCLAAQCFNAAGDVVYEL